MFLRVSRESLTLEILPLMMQSSPLELVHVRHLYLWSYCCLYIICISRSWDWNFKKASLRFSLDMSRNKLFCTQLNTCIALKHSRLFLVQSLFEYFLCCNHKVYVQLLMAAVLLNQDCAHGRISSQMILTGHCIRVQQTLPILDHQLTTL